MSEKLITIVGMGAGISQAVAEKFGQEGFKVAMLARTEEKLKDIQADLQNQGIEARFFQADAGNSASLKKAFQKIQQELGDTTVLLYNAAKVKKNHILEETSESIANDFKVNVGGALESVKAVLPAMQAKNEGTILFTGGGLSLYPNPDYGSLALGKAGIRNLAGSLHYAMKNSNIKVSTITVAGFVTPESNRHTPEAIAEEFWKIHQTPVEQLKAEVVY